MGNQHIYEHKFPAANEARRQAGMMPRSFSFGEGGQTLIFFWILIDVPNW
jgi:hypothetical protein